MWINTERKASLGCLSSWGRKEKGPLEAGNTEVGKNSTKETGVSSLPLSKQLLCTISEGGSPQRGPTHVAVNPQQDARSELLGIDTCAAGFAEETLEAEAGCSVWPQ